MHRGIARTKGIRLSEIAFTGISKWRNDQAEMGDPRSRRWSRVRYLRSKHNLGISICRQQLVVKRKGHVGQREIELLFIPAKCAELGRIAAPSAWNVARERLCW
jgi:hypothetical protein